MFFLTRGGFVGGSRDFASKGSFKGSVKGPSMRVFYRYMGVSENTGP